MPHRRSRRKKKGLLKEIDERFARKKALRAASIDSGKTHISVLSGPARYDSDGNPIKEEPMDHEKKSMSRCP